jgi:hypothetical protein
MSKQVRYCIGKATRHKSGDIVRQPSYSDPNHIRGKIYDTRAEAEQAALEAAKDNPAGFVVLILENNNA